MNLWILTCVVIFVVYIIIAVDGTETEPPNEPIHSRPKRDLLKNFVWVWDRVFNLAHDAFLYFKYRVFKYTDKSPYLIAPTIPGTENTTLSEEMNPYDIETEINPKEPLNETKFYEANFQPKVNPIGILATTTSPEEMIPTTDLSEETALNITTEVLNHNLTTITGLIATSSETTVEPNTTTEGLLNFTTKGEIYGEGFFSTEIPSKQLINFTIFQTEDFTQKENNMSTQILGLSTTPKIAVPTTTLASNTSPLTTRLFDTSKLTTVADLNIPTKKVSALARIHQKLLNILTKPRNFDPKSDLGSVTPDNDLNEIS